MNYISSPYLNNKTHIKYNIRSFVCRYRSLTKKQKFALNNFWSCIGVEFQRQSLNLTTLFHRKAFTVLEIGFGNGISLVAMAQQYPEKNFLGIEVYLPGVSRCLAAIRQANITNLRIIHHDAIEVLEEMISMQSLDMVQLFFPDPWHKTKHHKRRILQEVFAQQIKDKLKIGGCFHTATDSKNYAQHILTIMNSIPGYKNLSLDNTYVPRSNTRPLTKFELLGQNLGHGHWELMFQRIL
ncbi:tRNA (guanine-N(7)-)-methyltransferase [Candidatus Profftia lariciata]|nr:tRNA (guanosine(46)-N7)-methyltransferase TrmB [Candidatus Profftia lariciata]UDG81691.1 tRNA (guanine-N(7)-)-methyltransferase [Candidatus Profftia lariciata]